MKRKFGLRVCGLGWAMLLVSGMAAASSAHPDDQAEGQKALRLMAIAGEIQQGTNTASLIKEAAGLCGFSIWNDMHASLVPAASASSNHLAMFDSEITNYAKMFDNGQWMNLQDMTGSVDTALKRLGYPGSCKKEVYDWLNQGGFSDKPASRLIVGFVRDLSIYHENHTDSTFSDKAQIDAVQTLFVMRVLTEDVEVPIRKKLISDIHPTSLEPLIPDTSPNDAVQAQQGPIPTGPAEDAYAGLIGGLYQTIAQYASSAEGDGKIWQAVRDTGGRMTQLAKAAAIINPLATVVKFLSTYAFLGGDVNVEDADKTLIRTKSADPDTAESSPGNQKTLVALFQTDSTKFANFCGSYRQYFLAFGLDLDSPKTSNLSGINTDWKLTLPYGPIVQWSRGEPQEDKTPADSNGYSRRKIEGAPQRKTVPDDLATPVERSFTVKVTPQIKNSSAQQDAVDAMSSVLPFKDADGGDAGSFATAWITPVYEMIFRCKWQCTVKRTVTVKDYVAAPIVADINFQAQGNATGSQGDVHRTQTVVNFYRASGVPMKLRDFTDPLANMPAGTLDKLPQAARDMILQQLKNHPPAAKTGPPTYVTDANSSCEFLALVHDDSKYTDPNSQQTYATNYWNASGFMDIPSTKAMQDSSFEIVLDPAKGVAHINLRGRKLGHEEHRSDGPGALEFKDDASPIPVLVEVDINGAHENWDVPYTVEEVNGSKTYTGHAIKKFAMCWGQKFGRVDISFKIQFKHAADAPQPPAR